ncbi:MAG: helix-turn-helix transcriptional regulator, partial [Acidimicrobiales bacterium]
RADEAAAASEKAPVWAMVHRLMLAPAALEDGWGEPVAWARHGLPVFERRGLAELAGRCRVFLRQVGEPVPRRRRGDGELPSELVAVGVTGREADVLRLLASGLSNKAIGVRLYLSHRTVERHVENLLMKTEANDRRGLAALAEQAGLSSS